MDRIAVGYVNVVLKNAHLLVPQFLAGLEVTNMTLELLLEVVLAELVLGLDLLKPLPVQCGLVQTVDHLPVHSFQPLGHLLLGLLLDLLQLLQDFVDPSPQLLDLLRGSYRCPFRALPHLLKAGA